MPARLTQEEAIQKAREVWGDQYDLSLFVYKTSRDMVKVICPIHGVFEVKANNFLMGHGCLKCGRQTDAVKQNYKNMTMALEEFIRRAREVHGDKYDYSEVEYKNNYTKVRIVCPNHGAFEQTPSNHLCGRGCPICRNEGISGRQADTYEEYVSKARVVHGDKYSYPRDKLKVGGKDKIGIICPKHGLFYQRKNVHLEGKGCIKCRDEKFSIDNRKTQEQFIADAIRVHGADAFDYSNAKYKDGKTPIDVICQKCGCHFSVIPSYHLRGVGCPECAKTHFSEIRTKTFEDFVTDARNVHGDKYTYIEETYKNGRTKMTMICPEHGEFEQRPNSHIQGSGCPKCAGFQRTTDDFVNEAKKVHGDRYDYSSVDYKMATEKVCIICPKHGQFWQLPTNHIKGAGCPHCAKSTGEDAIYEWLTENNINHIRQYKVIPTQVLFGRNLFKIDFYLPDHNTFIEFNGRQHYERISLWDTEEQFAEQQDRDRRLREYCKQHDITLIEIPYTEIDNIDKILKSRIK